MAIFFAYAQKKVRKYVSDSGPCFVHIHIWASNFSILAYRFCLHMLISKDN